MTASVPDKPTLEGLEDKWAARWEADGTYRFDRSKTRDQIFSIDTPPPTVSGALHMGSVFGYVQVDTIARFHRMRGDELYYPMGWDDNGVPTERRVENFYGVRCDPLLPYDPDYEPPPGPVATDEKSSISRPNFVALCERLTVEDEKAFEAVWRRVGLSVDWSLTYTTIGDQARRVSQLAFLRMLSRREAYTDEVPTLCDVTFRTAVAQAELEDRERPGAFHRIRFDDIEIETTRPELIPACVALVAHPDDDRYKARFGSTVKTPLFGVDVPVVAHQLADPEKGSGIAMVCTFGDTTDVLWWRELRLPVRSIVTRDGRIQDGPPAGVADDDAWREVAGRTLNQARTRIVELLRESGQLDGDPRPITHSVKFFEKGDRPIEIVTSRQWWYRTLDKRERWLELGKELRWHPSFMGVRYDDWVNGLNSDWLISRQRFFGVPIPVWYQLDADGQPDYEHPLPPDETKLPVDPSTDVPDGYTEEQRGKPDGFIGDPDVMDTWATSSLSPQVVSGWPDDADLFERVYPMDLRPQGPDIIRTWLFYSVVRAELEFGALPWRGTQINGWILDPDRKKMSKSKGNVVTPLALLEQYSSDAVRYWADSARPGTDTAFDEGQMKIGRRLAIKILNASKFVLNIASGQAGGDANHALDRAMLTALDDLIEEATSAFERYDYARALERTETFFWRFCDDYVELVKNRAYGAHGDEAAASAIGALQTALSALLRLFAPFLPYVTEEVWSWWQDGGSVHQSSWPAPTGSSGDTAVFEAAGAALGEVRKAKSEAKKSMRAAIDRAVITDTDERIAALRQAESDLRDAGSISQLELRAGPEFVVEVELAPDPPSGR